ncbi:hypothetical protein GE21DRAFT_5271 [Neurospora crassa]|uniref:Uncharacterized protein n=2 Tax=Neurospora crassa TaxID=5141 RepID=Q7SAT5_NEUCR|nr:hypothetical protein NCU07634 [Neurospora crassa OR74A]EAA33498.2 hypothetical protein NCU07634 [Neurospora crassa OR74A]KHE84233.1 hypothetical protein GE21DRAFT_5271 [Neurospora crassa]CAE85485.1 hypothetical protein [Neurospora crassa]|eukprot:XP_962734.2 hypothetical protein NCU07634 [Neurospora crassa OR74A]
MSDCNTINTQAVFGFVDFLKSAAEREDPRLKTYWDIIINIQDNIIRPKTRTIRPFQEFEIPHGFQEFGKNAYDWLVFYVRCRTTETAVGAIGHTRPGLKQALVVGLAGHEKSDNRRTKREDPPNSQVLPGHSKSMAEFYATEGALKSLHHRTPEAGITDDIPQTREEQLSFVLQMAEALEDVTDYVDNNDSHQVQTVKRTSRTVFEHIAWRLLHTGILMQEGEPAVLPWSTSFYRRDYPTFRAQWNDMVLFLPKSKAAVANLLISPYWNRFAGDPDKELNVVADSSKVIEGKCVKGLEHEVLDVEGNKAKLHNTSRQAETTIRQSSILRQRERRQRRLAGGWRSRPVRQRAPQENDAAEAYIPQPKPSPQQVIIPPQAQRIDNPKVSYLKSQQERHTEMQGGIKNAACSEAEERDHDESIFTPNQMEVIWNSQQQVPDVNVDADNASLNGGIPGDDRMEDNDWGQEALSLSHLADPFSWSKDLATQAFINPMALYPVDNGEFADDLVDNAHETLGNNMPINPALSDSNAFTSIVASLDPVSGEIANNSDTTNSSDGTYAYGMDMSPEDPDNRIADDILQAPNSEDQLEMFNMDAFIMGPHQPMSGEDDPNFTAAGFVDFQREDEDLNDELSGDRFIGYPVAGTSGSKRKRDETDEEVV